MPAVFDQRYVKRLDGPNVKKGKNKRDLADQVVADIRAFKSKHGCDRLVMIWTGSTEVFMTQTAAHASLAAFEKALEQSDDSIPSSMVYAYAAIREGIPFANAAPNLAARRLPLRLARPETVRRCSRHHCAWSQARLIVFAAGIDNILAPRRRCARRPESFQDQGKSISSAGLHLQPHLFPSCTRLPTSFASLYPPRGDHKEGGTHRHLWLACYHALKIISCARQHSCRARIVLALAVS